MYVVCAGLMARASIWARALPSAEALLLALPPASFARYRPPPPPPQTQWFSCLLSYFWSLFFKTWSRVPHIFPLMYDTPHGKVHLLYGRRRGAFPFESLARLFSRSAVELPTERGKSERRRRRRRDKRDQHNSTWVRAARRRSVKVQRVVKYIVTL